MASFCSLSFFGSRCVVLGDLRCSLVEWCSVMHTQEKGIEGERVAPTDLLEVRVEALDSFLFGASLDTTFGGCGWLEVESRSCSNVRVLRRSASFVPDFSGPRCGERNRFEDVRASGNTALSSPCWDLLATMRRVVNYHSSWVGQRQVELFDASDIRVWCKDERCKDEGIWKPVIDWIRRTIGDSTVEVLLPCKIGIVGATREVA
ncbi:hypothetical protein F511_15465 [Dorcoceras hygrometricum]|uniref:Uncharacterized protein n=1 Tax=Dorcoceras hygrometricum TaxID=472368 RepID=A0A2Z7AMV2_9LAMI|nr:hypothetical protein F511_15465 [Dorcoceras hygrometricum]